MSSLDLWVIGNCQASALVDRDATFVWGCVPRFDGDPAFSSLLAEKEPQAGFWSVEIEDCVSVQQEYLRNTPILRTVMRDQAGSEIEVIDFCPRFTRSGRMYRPVAFVRLIRPLGGSPRIRMRLRPTNDWGVPARPLPGGSNHVRFNLAALPMRLTTDAPVGLVTEERSFRLERPLHFFFGPDESFVGNIGQVVSDMLERTTLEWQEWVRGLAIPLEWQGAVIRSAIALKLCQYEETGAIVAALTTSIPEHPGSGRNWDYRYCWIRDAYYTVQALNRLGALDVLEGYLVYLRNIVDSARGGQIQPLYSITGEANLEESTAERLPGYRGNAPVRVGNQAYEQAQHDAYGQIVLSSMQAFIDQRLFRPSELEDFRSLELVGERAWELHDQPDAGLWELRTRRSVHTYSAAMCWAACDRLASTAEYLRLADRAQLWRERAEIIRNRIAQCAWRESGRFMSATFDGDTLDASLLQLLDLRFFTPDDARFQGTLAAVEESLRRGSCMMRYLTQDDFGLPATAFNVCTFWLIEALHTTGRSRDARDLFAHMLERRTQAGLLSEDIDPASGELWGNYPQTYSLVGIINCAVLLSRPWSSVR